MVFLTILGTVASAGDDGGLLGKPTKVYTRRGWETQNIVNADWRGLRLSPDGRWLVYWKPTKPVERILGHGAGQRRKRREAEQNQLGVHILCDLKTGKEKELSSQSVSRKVSISLQAGDCFSPSSDCLVYCVRDEYATSDPNTTRVSESRLFSVSLGKRVTVRKIRMKGRHVLAALPLGDQQALLAVVELDGVEGAALVDELSLQRAGLDEEETKYKRLDGQGVPIATHPRMQVAAIYVPPRPRTYDPNVNLGDESNWHPEKLHLIDTESGKIIQSPILHPAHMGHHLAFFVGSDANSLAYEDIDLVQVTSASTGSEGQGRAHRVPAVRIWDMGKKKIVCEFKRYRILGTGPTKDTLVLRPGRWSDKAYLADIKTGRTWCLTESRTVLAARGGKVVYSEEKDGKTTINVAEIQLPDELRDR